MAKILGIIKKDIRLYLPHPSHWFFSLFLPIMFTVVLAFATGGFGGEIVLSYVDQANTPLSANLLQLIQEGDGLKTEGIDLATAQARFAEGNLDAYLVIPADFNTETLLNGSLSVQLFQQPNRTSSQTIYQALRLALTKLTSSQAKLRAVMQMYQTLHPEVSAAELENLTDQLSSEIQLEIANAPSRLIESVSQKGDEVIYDPVTSSSAGQLITWVFIPLVGLSGAMAYERQQGTLKRFLTTPTSHLTYFQQPFSDRS